MSVENMATSWLLMTAIKPSSLLTCPVCPCCLVYSGLCLCGLCHCWRRSMVFFWSLLWFSFGTLSCVSPYCCHGIALRADVCRSYSCPCYSRPGGSCPSAFQYLGTKTKKKKRMKIHWQVFLIIIVRSRETVLYLHVCIHVCSYF